MRILIVTRNLPPLVGGMERLNWHMAAELAKFADVRIVGPAGSAALAPAGVAMREAPLKPLRKFLWRARSLARSEARRWKPDLVLAGSGLTAPIAQSAARACGARTAVYVHGLDVAVRHLAYRAIWLPAIRRTDRVIANSRATAELCRGIGVDPARVGIVHPGVEMPTDTESLSQRERGTGGHPHSPDVAEAQRSPSIMSGGSAGPNPESSSWALGARSDEAFRQRHDLGNGPLLLSVGRLSARKGLREFVKLALPRVVAVQPDAMLLVVGDAPSQALHAEAQTPASIQAAAEMAGVGGHIRFLGIITNYVELGVVYRAADVHVFPVRDIPGDPEGFGMVAVEAAAHSLPTVAFATGGVVDAVNEGASGELVAPGDYAAFAAATLRLLSGRETLRASCVEFARQFAWPEFGARLARQVGLA